MTGVTRRDVIAGGIGIAGAAALGGGAAACAPAEAPAGGPGPARSPNRMPVVFLPHGGGPWPWVDGMFPAAENRALAAYLDAVRGAPRVAPKAILVISAHWEERIPTVMTSAQPPLLFDYYGFPDHTYQLTWPAPGAPALATRIRTLLDAAGIASGTDDARGFDHGVFVPLKLVYPDPAIPTAQLSLQAGLDPAQHIAIGKALAPLRDEGVFIIGSGMSYHNMRGFFDRGSERTGESASFDQWLVQASTATPSEREKLLGAWTEAPAARACHPREEHLLPLMVCAGAAGDDRGVAAFTGTVGGKHVSAFQWG